MTQDLLHFLSTQIQARHEEHSASEARLSRLSGFSAAQAPVAVKPVAVARKRRKRLQKSKSISEFVRESLANKTDPQLVLDYFAGNEARASTFIAKMQKVGQSLFSESEWRAFQQCIRLKFPSTVPASGLACESDGDSLWTGALALPQLSEEERRWLYGNREADSQDCVSSFYMTLSQALDTSPPLSHGGSRRGSHAEIDPHSAVQDSEPDLEPLAPTLSFVGDSESDDHDYVSDSESSMY